MSYKADSVHLGQRERSRARRQLVWQWRHGEHLTLAAIGRRLGVTGERVRQILWREGVERRRVLSRAFAAWQQAWGVDQELRTND